VVPSNLTISGYSNTTVYLDFLNRTQIDNLYPFVAVLPSGGIFIAYYNEARILDEVTFDTIKTLPNIPVSIPLRAKACSRHRRGRLYSWMRP